MKLPLTHPTRRQVLRHAATATVSLGAGGIGLNAWAQTSKGNDADLAITQIVDVSQAQQDVSKDYLIGARAAWAEVNQQGGVLGRKLVHRTIDVDGSPASVKAALTAVRDNPSVLALFGTVGHAAAAQVTQLLKQEKSGLAHVAPWLQIDAESQEIQTFPIFATRAEQIAFAVKNLSAVNVREVGAVYASAAEYAAHKDEVERSAGAMNLKVTHFQNGSDMVGLGQRLKLDSPAILLFLGGTPELAKFTQGLEQQSRMRFCVAMADVNLQTLAQMGTSRRTPIVVTQVVPMVNAHLPVVRAYRDIMTRLYDEPPTPVSLAGYLAARYTYEVLKTLKEPPSRQSTLAAFQRSANVNLGGFHVGGPRRAGNYVTQSMLATDGRLIG